MVGTSDKDKLVNGDPQIDKERFLLTGLKNFSSDYYKSKFIVLKVLSSNNGKVIYIEFIDKPDKIFQAGVYPASKDSYDLRFFGQNLQTTKDNLTKLNTRYSFLLNDKAHAL